MPLAGPRGRLALDALTAVVDDEEARRRGYEEALSELGAPRSLAQRALLAEALSRGAPRAEILKEVLAEFGVRAGEGDLLRAVERFCVVRASRARLAEDLSFLPRSGVFSVAVFIWEEPGCARALSSALGIRELFSEVAYVPPRGDWLRLLSLLRVDVFASGSLERVAAASASGLKSVWISRGLNLESPLPRAESIRDLLSMLSRGIV